MLMCEDSLTFEIYDLLKRQTSTNRLKEKNEMKVFLDNCFKKI